jgi:Uma2 family endonuclease
MSAANQLPDAMTVAEFLAWSPPDGSDRWELIEGAPRSIAPASPRHGAIQGEASRLIGNHLAEMSGPACRVVIEPGIQPKVRADVNVRIPDLVVTCAAVDADDRLLREPLVVIEILSPSNRADTWANMWSYTAIPSVREILVLQTADIGADLLRREEAGSWPDNPLALTLGDAVTLESIDFTVSLAQFYRTA